MPSATSVSLRRSLWARLAGGYRFQVIVSIAIIAQLLLIGVLIGFGVPIEIGTLAPALPGMLVIWAVWLFGVFASARVDGAGVHVRYFVARTYRWADMSAVDFTNMTVYANAGQVAIVLTVDDKNVPIRPAYQCTRKALVEFGDALTALAGRHGVEVSVKARERRWAGLAAYPAG